MRRGHAGRRMRCGAIRKKETVHRSFPVLALNVSRADDFAQALHESLGLAIRLRPQRGYLLGVEANFLREILKSLAVEWRSIIRTHNVRYTMYGNIFSMAAITPSALVD